MTWILCQCEVKYSRSVWLRHKDVWLYLGTNHFLILPSPHTENFFYFSLALFPNTLFVNFGKKKICPVKSKNKNYVRRWPPPPTCYDEKMVGSYLTKSVKQVFFQSFIFMVLLIHLFLTTSFTVKFYNVYSWRGIFKITYVFCSNIYRITSVLKIETDVITCIVSSLIIVIMCVRTFKSDHDVVVIIGNFIMCLKSHWLIISVPEPLSWYWQYHSVNLNLIFRV